MKLDLNDLQPQEATFELGEFPGEKFVLKKFNLATRIWLNNRFGQDKIKEFFTNQSMPEISEVVFYMLKDKSKIPSLEEFQEKVVTRKDMASIFQALLTTIGISEPVVDQIAKDAAQGNALSLNQPIGAQSTT